MEVAPSIPVELLEKFSGESKNINETLYSIATNSKFRRTAIDDESREDVKRKINEAVSKNLPIEFSIPFGGYKNYRVPAYPEADWAEVFNLRFMIRYLLPIAKLYEAGVVLYYSYNSGIMNEVSNMPIEFQKTYEASFIKLVNYFNELCPTNFEIKIQPINDLYVNATEWKNEFNALYERNKKEWTSLYNEESREKKIQSARHNLILNGERNLLGLSEKELETEYLNAAMMCDALDSLSQRRKFNKYSHRIQLVFVRGPKTSIHVGVCEGATMHFWVGLGVLGIRKNIILPRIFSFEQLQINKNEIEETEVENYFTSISKNFSKVFFKKEIL